MYDPLGLHPEAAIHAANIRDLLNMERRAGAELRAERHGRICLSRGHYAQENTRGRNSGENKSGEKKCAHAGSLGRGKAAASESSVRAIISDFLAQSDDGGAVLKRSVPRLAAARQSKSRKRGDRFSENDRRPRKNPQHSPIQLNRDVLQRQADCRNTNSIS